LHDERLQFDSKINESGMPYSNGPRSNVFFSYSYTVTLTFYFLVYVDVQREVYPTLLLFPAESKNTVCYEGDMAVADVITFLADRGSNSRHLTSENGNFLTRTFHPW
jgi:hypothetical protein